jgi:hypothetical protein
MPARHLAPLLLLAATFSAADAQPRPRARTTFAATARYRYCAVSTRFACMMPDGHGGTYGTPTPLETCTSYTFRPDGTVDIGGDVAADHATYRISGRKVTLTMAGADGSAPTRWDLVLSTDGSSLGDLRRIE